MYFDPLSAWLVALIADGIVIAGQKSTGGTAVEYHQKNIKQRNANLNGAIRRIKEKYGLTLAEMAYEQIQLQIKIAKNSISFQHGNGQIVIDLDNQEYIISVLEECSKWYGKYSYEEAKKKAEWYKNAAVEARRRKEQYTKQLEETRIREAKEQEKQQVVSNILLIIGLVIFVGFIVFFFS